MSKRRFVPGIFLVLAIVTMFGCAVPNDTQNTPCPWPEPSVQDIKRADVMLLKYLTLGVSSDQVVVNKQYLKQIFFPHLGLSAGDEIIDGAFGTNTDGRYFMLTIRKVSSSGNTNGLFEVAFNTERHVSESDTPGLYRVSFRVSGGHAFGSIALKTYPELISIYDLALGRYLVNDKNGKTVDSLQIPESEYWSPEHTASNLINAGKTIGGIIEEHLEALESTGKGGKVYSDDAMRTYSTFSGMDPEGKFKVYFKEKRK